MVSDAAYLLILLTGGSLLRSVLFLVAASFIATIGGPITAINQQSLQQAITPHQMQGRVNGTMRFLAWCIGPVGALVAGVLGERIGLRPTLVAATVGLQLGFVVLLISPIPRFHEPSPSPQSTSSARDGGGRIDN